MSDTETVKAPPRWLTSAPLMGLVVLSMMIMDKPLGHTFAVGIFRYMMNMWGGLLALFGGALGIFIIYRGLKLDDIRASLSGWIGASLVWTCWFEFILHGVGDMFGIPYVKNAAGEPVLTGAHVILLSASPFCFMLLFLLGINKDTRCRMFMWIRRQLRMKPGKPTPGYKRQYSRIVAMETILLFWMIYIIDLIMLHPMVAGSDSSSFLYFWIALGVWLLYLFYKLSKIRELGLALRYALPVSMFLWLFIEMGSQMHFYTEIWIEPAKYPIPILIMFGYMLLIISAVWRQGKSLNEQNI